MIPTLVFAAAALAIVIRLSLLAALQASGSRHPVRDAVSDYGVGPSRARFESMSLAATAGWWLLALGTWIGYLTWSDRTFVTVALAVIGVTTALLRFFPTDLPGTRRTATGLVHYALAITQFALTYSVMGNLVRLLGGAELTVLHIATLVGLSGLCLWLVPALQRRLPVFGLMERVFLISSALFYLDVAVRSAAHLA